MATGTGIFLWKATLILMLIPLRAATQPDSVCAPPPPGRLVDIGGWSLHLYGSKSEKEGPTVILEAGAGDFSFDWALVQPKVARFASVYSYDRAGHAWSDMGPGPHTLRQTVYNLRTLLRRANVPPPYILVGASYGGYLVRAFARQHPDEVAGVILVDAGFEDNKVFIDGKVLQPSIDAKGIAIPPAKSLATSRDNQLTAEARTFLREVLAKQGLPDPRIHTPYNNLPPSAQPLRLWALSRLKYFMVNSNDYFIEELALLFRDRQDHPFMFGQKPLLVLTRGRPYEQVHIDRQKELLSLSHNSKQVIAERSGHHIQLETPDLIVEAVRQVTKAVRENIPLNQLPSTAYP